MTIACVWEHTVRVSACIRGPPVLFYAWCSWAAAAQFPMSCSGTGAVISVYLYWSCGDSSMGLARLARPAAQALHFTGTGFHSTCFGGRTGTSMYLFLLAHCVGVAAVCKLGTPVSRLDCRQGTIATGERHHNTHKTQSKPALQPPRSADAALLACGCLRYDQARVNV